MKIKNNKQATVFVVSFAICSCASETAVPSENQSAAVQSAVEGDAPNCPPFGTKPTNTFTANNGLTFWPDTVGEKIAASMVEKYQLPVLQWFQNADETYTPIVKELGEFFGVPDGLYWDDGGWFSETFYGVQTQPCFVKKSVACPYSWMDIMCFTSGVSHMKCGEQGCEFGSGPLPAGYTRLR